MRTSSWLSIGILVSLLAVSGCNREKVNQRPLIPVRTAPVEETVQGEGVRYSATINPYTQVDVSFKANGYIKEIKQMRGADGRMRNVQEGDFISGGTVLARIVEDDHIQRVDEAKAHLAATLAAFEKAGQDYSRATRLFSTQSVTKPDYDTAKAQFEETRARVEGAKAQLEEARIQLRYCTLKAPLDGVVLKRNIEVGTLATPAMVAFVMADVTAVKAVFGVPDMMLVDCGLGSTVNIVTESLRGRSFSGRITAVSPSADPKSRVFDVEITLPNPDDLLKAGMIASLQLPMATTLRRVPLVPLSAIVRSPHRPDGYALFALREQQGKHYVQLHDVGLGDVYGSRIEVLEGVGAGEQIVVTGATLISDGEQVRIIP
ncbi:MAG TPA: efflux RND transporter periplasmic adaptor subunit [Syntrophobacteraceae bacterium]|nr:efflux RND transporter periplasmic adaptor subunit [Syntrophobacteraceae bacterium]HBZ54641.1 efflux RND transporter periplasmic adaptor subunit [Syntrophobacteraceae bacterium]